MNAYTVERSRSQRRRFLDRWEWNASVQIPGGVRAAHQSGFPMKWLARRALRMWRAEA